MKRSPALRQAATLELHDQLTFEFYDRTEASDVRAGVTARFKVFIGATELTTVSVDVVVDHVPIGLPVTVQLTPAFEVKGIDDWPEVQLYPIVDHVADKICAMLERHGTGGSTRFRDLVDLILIIRHEEIDGAELHAVLRKEVLRRQERGVAIELPQHFAVPDASTWTPGYAAQAKNVAGFEEFLILAPAEEFAARFINPLLTEQSPGAWDPATRTWR